MKDYEEDVPAAMSRDSSDPELPDSITSQEEVDEAVNDWLFDLELDGSTSGLPRDVCNGVLFTRHHCQCNYSIQSLTWYPCCAGRHCLV